jgi:hypothetical protein
MMVNVLWVCVAALFVLLFMVHWEYWRDARESRKDSSRFGMFAVRDRLVQMVACGEMHEDDPAWQMMYRTANDLLDLSYQTTTLGQLTKSARHASRIAHDPRWAENLVTVDELLRKGEQHSPVFASVVHDMEKAFASMTRARAPLWQWWTMVVIVLATVPSLVVGRAARHLFFNPTAALAATPFPRAAGSRRSPRLAAA